MSKKIGQLDELHTRVKRILNMFLRSDWRKFGCNPIPGTDLLVSAQIGCIAPLFGHSIAGEQTPKADIAEILFA